MPVSRPLAEDLARVLVELYTAAETRLAAGIARMLADDMDAPDWALQKLTAIGGVRELAERIVRRLDTQSAAEVEQMLILAHARGGQAALDELGRLGSAVPSQVSAIRKALPGSEAIQRLVWSLVSTLRGTHLRIVRWSLDTYRTVVARASADTLLGVATRRRTAQVAWEQLLSRGITGFTDRAGRNWELASYVEMATRTTVAQAAVEGHLDRLGAAGLDLVIVSNAPQECIKCRPWEGKVLTRTGVGGSRELELEHTTRPGQMVTVDVAGSVAEAVLAGLMHPNCRHSLSAYLPGVTRAPTNTEDPEGDRNRQQLRYLERQVRSWKLRQAAAIDPAAAKAAAAKVRDYQARIREHIAATGLHRQPAREQIGTAR
ncbi:phage minor capsid protein [Micromonospora sp. CB01531]|uniref:phage minor capsid protein n=1 Tax=Micromonospora sp. CB01531 TaxID=1718947 RepID=UPI00093971F0|nr:phage minor capsid protein [Micromonospora sp. CB01531]OKI47227.1 minor capsid protein [Micromonospora sp. CB01531]